MQFMALLWHVYQRTHNNAYVGALGLIRVVPLVSLGLFGGVIADHFDRRKVLLITQLALAVIAIAIALVTIHHVDSVGTLYLLVAAGAVASAFNGPVRQAIVVNLVPREDFPNAAAINGITWRLSDILGPMFTGWLLAWTSAPYFSGLAWIYVINAVSFLGVIWAVLLLPKKPPSSAEQARDIRAAVIAIKQGYRYFKDAAIIRNTMIVDFWATFFAGAEALLPSYADLMKLGKTGYGYLASATGTGALIASVYAAMMPTIQKQGLWVLRMVGLFGIATIFFGFSVNLPMAFICLAASGAADMISTVLRQTIRQLAVPDHMRGRLGSIGMIFQISGPQLGDAEAGLSAQALTLVLAPLQAVRGSIIIGGIGSVFVSWWWMRKSALSKHEYDPDRPPEEH